MNDEVHFAALASFDRLTTDRINFMDWSPSTSSALLGIKQAPLDKLRTGRADRIGAKFLEFFLVF